MSRPQIARLPIVDLQLGSETGCGSAVLDPELGINVLEMFARLRDNFDFPSSPLKFAGADYSTKVMQSGSRLIVLSVKFLGRG
jgi:hypothetical protein